MNNSVLDAIVVGAGHAGLTSSYYLKKYGLNHIVFERGRIAESWISMRWHSFKLTSPKSFAPLPGDKYEGDDPDGYFSAPEFVAYLNDYVSRYQLPVRENAKILAVDYDETHKIFRIKVSESNHIEYYQSRQVIIASGSMNEMIIPALAKQMPASIKHIHAGQYRHPAQIQEGAILVVGNAQSGSQIADDLCKAGRKVYLSTSKVGRIPRVYRGKDIYHWVVTSVFFTHIIEELGFNETMALRSPPSISLQALAQKGVTIVGRLVNAEQDKLVFLPNAAENIKFGDMFSEKVKRIIDDYLVKNSLEAPAPDFDIDDAPDDKGCWDSLITDISIKDSNISSIVWATGFLYDYKYIKLPVLSNTGYPKHQNGLSEIKGLYFPGLFGGSSIHGIKDDLEYLIERICQYANSMLSEAKV